MKYWQVRKLSATKFKRFCGVKRQTFRLMVRLGCAQKQLVMSPAIAKKREPEK